MQPALNVMLPLDTTERTKVRARALVAIASYGTRNDRYLSQLVREYRSMSFDVDIVVLSNIAKDVAPGVEVVVVDLRGKDPWSLPFAHKRILGDRLNDYDLFIYSEDDTLIRERAIRAFLEVCGALREDEIAGFIRYEDTEAGNRNYPEVHGHFHWDPASVCTRGPYTLAFFTNEHSACYVLTQAQLRRAINSGGYLVGPHQGWYDLLCTAATDPYTQCGFKKYICISHLDHFLIHHLPNKFVGTKFGVDDRELRRQVQVLLRIAQNSDRPASLFETETKLSDGSYSKSYYEPIRPEVVSVIPKEVRTVVSIGCGWGATECYLAERGLRVTAVPLDPVIPGGAEAAALEVIPGGLAQVVQELGGRQFDCLLLSNVLHLVPDPPEVLSSMAPLLRQGGTAVAVLPNMLRLAATWRALQGDTSWAAWGGYSKTGTHRVSERIFRRWFRSAGMEIERVIRVAPQNPRTVRGLATRLLDRWMAREFLIVGRKRSCPAGD